MSNFFVNRYKFLNKVFIILIIEVFAFSQISCASFIKDTDYFSYRVVRGANPDILPPVEVQGVSEEELWDYLESLGIPTDDTKTIPDLEVDTKILAENDKGIPTKVAINIEGRQIVIEKVNGKYNIKGLELSETPFRFEGDTLYLSRGGKTAKIDGDSVQQLDERSASWVEYGELPQFTSREEFLNYIKASLKENGPTYGMDSIKDVDLVTKAKTKQGKEVSFVLTYDEEVERIKAIFYKGTEVYDKVKELIESGSTAEEAINEVIDDPPSKKIGQGGGFKDKNRRGKWLLYTATALAMAEAAVSAYGFGSIASGGIMAKVSSLLCAGITGAWFYSMYKPAALRTIKGITSMFFSHKKTMQVMKGAKMDQEVLAQGPKDPAMITIQTFITNDEQLEELKRNIEKTLENNKIDKDKLKDKLYFTIVSSTAKETVPPPEMIFKQIKLIKELNKKYGDWVKFSFFLRNPVQQEKGFKPLTLLFLEDLIVNGHRKPADSGAYIENGFRRYKVPAEEPTFIGNDRVKDILTGNIDRALQDAKEDRRKLEDELAHLYKEIKSLRNPLSQRKMRNRIKDKEKEIQKVNDWIKTLKDIEKNPLISKEKAEQFMDEGFITFNRKGYVDLAKYLGVPEPGGKNLKDLDNFIFLDQGNNIAGPHDGNKHGDLLRWLAKVSWSDQNVFFSKKQAREEFVRILKKFQLGKTKGKIEKKYGKKIDKYINNYFRNKSKSKQDKINFIKNELGIDSNMVIQEVLWLEEPVYDMFVPRLGWDPKEIKQSMLAGLQDLDDKQNLGFLIGENWYMNYHSSGGKMLVKGSRHTRRFLTSLREGEKLLELADNLPGNKRPLQKAALAVSRFLRSNQKLKKLSRPLRKFLVQVWRMEYVPELLMMLAPNMTSHDRWESFNSRAARFLDIMVNEERPATVPGSINQMSRFAYGDITETWEKYFPQSVAGRWTRKLLRLGKTGVPAPTRPEHKFEHRPAPVNFALGDPRFTGFLAWMTAMAYMSEYVDVTHFWPALSMGINVALFQHIFLPKFLEPLVTDMKTNVYPKLKQAFQGRTGESMLRKLYAGTVTGGLGLWEVGKEVGKKTVGGTASLVGDWAVYMPMMLIKPYLSGKLLSKNKFWLEFGKREKTEWARKKGIESESIFSVIRKNFKGKLGEWKKQKLDRAFSNLVVPAMGIAWAYTLTQILGPNWRWIGAPQYVFWTLWPFTSSLMSSSPGPYKWWRGRREK